MAKSPYMSRKLLNELKKLEKDVYQPISDKDLVRYAENEMDYSSIGLGVNGRNIFVTDDVLATKIIDMLR